MEESLNIEDYKEQLTELCPSCKKLYKCHDLLNKLCAYKKFVFALAKRRLKKNQKLLEER